MELRTQNSRATKDVDLALFERDIRNLRAEPQLSETHKLLIQAASIDLGDYFTFEIGKAKRELFSPPYGGARFSIKAIVSKKLFVRFNLDVGLGDPKTETENLHSRDWLNFAGIYCPEFPAISADQQFADKLYVYTIPRNVANSRAKDLVDMVLLIKGGELSLSGVKKTLELIFNCYDTHPIPDYLPSPPQEWEEEFAQLTSECKLRIGFIEAFVIVEKFYSKLIS